MIVHKYSRSTQRQFTVLGLVTQQGSRDDAAALPEVDPSEGIKQALRGFADYLRDMENLFSAPLANEVILDPIAIYSVV